MYCIVGTSFSLFKNTPHRHEEYTSTLGPGNARDELHFKQTQNAILSLLFF